MSSPNKKSILKSELPKSQLNIFNSQSPIHIPKIPNKYKRSKTPSNNVLPFQDNNKNFLISPKNDEPSQIKFLKQSYENRIVQLYDMLKNLASKMTSMNTTECINEIVFMEKERIISDLNEQYSIIKTEYEENKIEMNRLQKVISVLEIDLNKCEMKLKEKKQELNNLNSNFSNLQAENFDLNLKIKELIDEYNKCKNENQSNQTIYYENIINDLKNQINNNLQDFNNKIIEVENNLKLEYENKIKGIEEKIKKEYDEIIEEINSKNEIEKENIIQHYQSELNQFQNSSVSKFQNYKQINEKNESELKKLQNDIDILLGENQKLSNKNKTNEQIIILLRSKISGIKSEITTLRKFVKNQLENLSIENYNYSNIIFSKLKTYLNKYNEDFINEQIDEKVKETEFKYENDLIEQLKLVKQYQKENKNLLENQNNYIEQNKNLSKQRDELEKENKLLNNTINKLKVELEVVKDALNNKQEDNNSTTISNESIFQLKELINNMRIKYQKEIQKIKNQLNSLYKSAENFNDDQSQKNKEKENKKDILIQLLQKKLEKYKLNQEQFKKVLEKKDNKIKELKGLQEFYSKSYKSIQGGVHNIKIAKLLDNEVQSILKEEKSKTTNNTFNKYGA